MSLIMLFILKVIEIITNNVILKSKKLLYKKIPLIQDRDIKKIISKA